jgi:hypothetical protein
MKTRFIVLDTSLYDLHACSVGKVFLKEHYPPYSSCHTDSHPKRYALQERAVCTDPKGGKQNSPPRPLLGYSVGDEITITEAKVQRPFTYGIPIISATR